MNKQGVNNVSYISDERNPGQSESYNISQFQNVQTSIKRRRKIPCCWKVWIVLGSFSFLMGFSMIVGGFQAMFDAILRSVKNKSFLYSSIIIFKYSNYQFS